MTFTHLNPHHVLPFTHLPVDPRKYADLRKCCGSTEAGTRHEGE